MKSSIPSIFVLTLMCFTISYGLVFYPETGLLEPMVQNSTSDVTQRTISEQREVGMIPKDGSRTVRDFASDSHQNVLPEVDKGKTESSNSSEPIVLIPAEVSTPVEDESPQDNSETPIPVAESPVPEEDIEKDDTQPIVAEDPIVSPNSSESETETSSKNNDFSLDDFFSSAPATTESEKSTTSETEKQDEKTSEPETKEAQTIVDEQIKPVDFEQPTEKNTGTIPRKTISLDSNEEQSASATESTTKETSNSDVKDNPTNTTEVSPISLPLLDSQDSIKSPETEKPTESTELQDNLGFQIPATGNISVKRFPPADQAIEPIYNRNMDRFALEN